jgi:ABC-2 type transport system ATP-binding protein
MSHRLGIAGALLGDPDVLMFDEPVNGLDPEGIVWIRTLMQGLARDGRTVLVSSHLLSEMAVTAAHLIVIGRGALIADCSTQEFLDQAVSAGVILRTPDHVRVLPELPGTAWSMPSWRSSRWPSAHWFGIRPVR